MNVKKTERRKALPSEESVLSVCFLLKGCADGFCGAVGIAGSYLDLVGTALVLTVIVGAMRYVAVYAAQVLLGIAAAIHSSVLVFHGQSPFGRLGLLR